MNRMIRFAALLMIVLAGVAGAYAQAPTPQLGDFGSVASGVWSTAATWKIYSSNNAFDSTAAAAPTNANNVWIMGGDTVTTTASAMLCKNLYIVGNSLLHNTSGSYQGNPAYLDVRGGLVYVETGSSFGNGPTESQGIDMKRGTGDSTWVFTGGGTYYICRLRDNTTGFNVDSIIIDANVHLTYIASSGGSGMSLYTDQGSSKIISTVVVNAGKTLTTGTNSNIGTGSSVNSDVVNAPTFSIYGNLELGAGATFSLRSTGGSPVVHVYPGGSVTVARNFTPSSATSQVSNIIVDAGASFTVGTSGTGTADFTRPDQFVTGGGSFAIDSGATIAVGATAGLDATNGPLRTATRTYTDAIVSYVGSAAQVTGADMPAAVRKLAVNNAAGVTLSKDLMVDTLAFGTGNLVLGDRNLILAPTPGAVSGAAAGKCVVTNGLGMLTAAVNTSGTYTWPVGTATAMLPLSIHVASASGQNSLSMGLRQRSVYPTIGPIAAGAKVLDHYFHVEDAGTSNLQVDTVFTQYLNDDVTAQGIVDETALRVYRTTTGVWDSTTVASIDTATNLIAFTNVNGPGDFIITDANGTGPGAVFSTKSVAFGQVMVQTSAVESVIVSNGGTSTLTISGVVSSDGHFVVAPTTATLAAGASQAFSVTFTPDSSKSFAGTIVFTHDGTPTSDTVALTGSGLGVMKIRDARSAGVGVQVLIEGIVTRGMGSYIRMQDSTAGIAVYRTSTGTNHSLFDSLAAGGIANGDVIRLYGMTYQYKGLYEVNDTSIVQWQKVASGQPMPAPVKVTLAQIAANGEQYESLLIEVDNLTVTTTDLNFVASKNYSIADSSDATHAVLMRLDNAMNTEVAGDPVPPAFFRFVGVLGQYTSTTGGYQLAPVLHTDITALTGVAELPSGIPTVYSLEKNFPNPFNPTTNIQYGLPQRSQVAVTVYTVLGQEVATLIDGVQSAGFHRVVWNGKHESGINVASGVYFYRIVARPLDGGNTFTQVQKMMLLK